MWTSVATAEVDLAVICVLPLTAPERCHHVRVTADPHNSR